MLNACTCRGPGSLPSPSRAQGLGFCAWRQAQPLRSWLSCTQSGRSPVKPRRSQTVAAILLSSQFAGPVCRTNMVGVGSLGLVLC